MSFSTLGYNGFFPRSRQAGLRRRRGLRNPNPNPAALVPSPVILGTLLCGVPVAVLVKQSIIYSDVFL